MKPNLVMRIAAAAAFAGIAALVSGCGSSSSAGVAGVVGASGLNGQTCTGMTQAVAFSGVAEEDSYGNIYAGENIGPLTLSGSGAVGAGGYEFGRVNTTDGSTLEFNVSSTGTYGGQMSIQGVYMMGEDVLTVLGTMGSTMGYGYGYPTTGYPSGYPSGYGTTGCGVSSITIYEMGAEPMMEAASVLGEQPFTYALVSGELILNGEINAPY